MRFRFDVLVQRPASNLAMRGEPAKSNNVCSWEWSGKDLLVVSLTGSDPEQA